MTTPLLCLFLAGREEDPLPASQEGCLQTYVCCETRCTGHGGPVLTVEDDLVLSLSCVSEVLFCPVPMRVSSFLATLIPANHAVAWHPGPLLLVMRASMQEDSLPGGGNRCHLLNNGQYSTEEARRPNVKPIRLISSLQELKIKIQ